MAMREVRGHGRAERAADAAIEVIAADGMRGLTHRAVDAHAGLPPGSTSSCFRTRIALLDGVLDRLVALQETMLEQWPVTGWDSATPEGRERIVTMLTDLLEYWLGPGRAQSRARLDMYLDAVRRPELRASLEASSDRFLVRIRDGMADAGLDAPDEHARLMIAQLDGVLFDALTRPFFGPTDRSWLHRAATGIVRGLLP